MAFYLTLGKECPRCGMATYRRHTPRALRLFKPLLRHLGSFRRCEGICGWWGFSFGRRRRRGPPAGKASA